MTGVNLDERIGNLGDVDKINVSHGSHGLGGEVREEAEA